MKGFAPDGCSTVQQAGEDGLKGPRPMTISIIQSLEPVGPGRIVSLGGACVPRAVFGVPPDTSSPNMITKFEKPATPLHG